jgi:hypothetical protein
MPRRVRTASLSAGAPFVHRSVQAIGRAPLDVVASGGFAWGSSSGQSVLFDGFGAKTASRLAAAAAVQQHV